MTTAAAATNRIRVGFDVALFHGGARPPIVATASTALDRFSCGRLIFGVGLGGAPREFDAFGEPSDEATRAAMLDEALAVLNSLWAGDRVQHHGRFYTADDVTLSPLPRQRPRRRLFGSVASRGALRRAAAWDGCTVGNIADAHGRIVIEPDELRRRLDVIGRRHQLRRSGRRSVPAGRPCSAGWFSAGQITPTTAHSGRGPRRRALERANRRSRG